MQVQDTENSRDSANKAVNDKTKSASKVAGMGKFEWFRMPSFYLVAVVYMVTRLFVNVSTAYISLYLETTLRLEGIFVAVVPLVMHTAGFIVSVILQFLSKRINFKASFAVSCLIGIG